jgi:hypothetical protein
MIKARSTKEQNDEVSIHPRARVPATLTLTYAELQTIQALAKHALALEQMPDGLWRGDLRDLERDVKAALESITATMRRAFPENN